MLAALLLAGATRPAPTPRMALPVVDAEIAQVTAALAAVEAPLVKLLATEQRLALARSPDARAALAGVAAAVKAAAPGILARTGELRRRRAALAFERASLLLAALPGPARSRMRPFLGLLDRCPAWRMPPEIVAVAPGTGAGLTLVTLPGAPVPAPAPARVAYAARFRGYGGVVILDHGRGWTTLLTGLDRLVVAPRQLVAGGEPVGTAPPALPLVEAEVTRRGRPVDLSALLARCAPPSAANPRSHGAPRILHGAS